MGTSLNTESILNIINNKKTPRASASGGAKLITRQSLPPGTNIQHLFHPKTVPEEQEESPKPFKIRKRQLESNLPSQYCTQ